MSNTPKKTHIKAKAVFCPLCHAKMLYAGSKVGLDKDLAHNIIQVVRRIYLCPSDSCGNVVSFKFRTDGQEGDMHRILEAEKRGERKKRVTIIEGLNE